MLIKVLLIEKILFNSIQFKMAAEIYLTEIINWMSIKKENLNIVLAVNYIGMFLCLYKQKHTK